MFAEFRVPYEDSQETGTWLWELASWPGVKQASLDATLAIFDRKWGATLEVQATKDAMQKVKKFCASRGYKERT